jgi:glyoxylase-like metal-dependent hydrolase (beta-lactamase superfamily II)
MIPAPGHTPGSVMFFVKVADGHEYLFLGDIAWVRSNITDLSMRPRFTEQFFMHGENRAQVADQIRALHELAVAEPDLGMIPAHDGPLIAAGIIMGRFKENFFVDGP